MRVDAHFHVWDLEAHRYPWLQDGEPAIRAYGDSAPLRRSYRIDDYLADARACGVEAGVYVQCGMQDPLEEVRYVQSLADETGDDFPIMIVGYADLNAEGAEAALDAFAAVPNVRGLRYSIAWDADPAVTFTAAPVALDGDNFQRAFARLGELGLRLDCMLYPAQMAEMAALCARQPATPVIINHAGLPLEAADPGLERWRDGMRLLADNPQVSVKISGLGMLMRDWTTTDADRAAAIIDETIAIFGVERCMIGSNQPVESLSSSFAATWRAFETALAHRSEADRRKLSGENALHLYGF